MTLTNKWTNSDPVTDDEVRGLWQRAYIKSPVTHPVYEDHETIVFWFQAKGIYADIRVPKVFPDGIEGASLADLSVETLQKIGTCEGFAGRSSVEHNVCTWLRYINLQGPETGRDIGRLVKKSEGLFEFGVEADFVELWQKRPINVNAIQAQVFAGDDSWMAILIHTPQRFLFACDKPVRKKNASTFKDKLSIVLETETANSEVLAALFEPEYCFGHFEGASAIITLSTHPTRVGDIMFEANPRCASFQTLHRSFNGEAYTRFWQKISAERI